MKIKVVGRIILRFAIHAYWPVRQSTSRLHIALSRRSARAQEDETKIGSMRGRRRLTAWKRCILCTEMKMCNGKRVFFLKWKNVHETVIFALR